MMYICPVCGEVYDEDEAFRTSYIYDDCRVRIARCDDLGYCEHCGHELEPAKHCTVCDAYIPEDGPDLCDCCIEDSENVETALRLGEDCKATIEINGFVASLGTEWIAAMLTEIARCKFTDAEAKQYVHTEIDALAEMLEYEKCEKERQAV